LIKDFPLPGETIESAQFYPATQNWLYNLPILKANNLYKLYINNTNGSTLSWTPFNNMEEGGNGQNGKLAMVDPMDPTTWIENLNSEKVMPLIAQVIVDGTSASNTSDKIGVFKGDTLYGVSNLIDVNKFNTMEFITMVEDFEGVADIYYYQASSDSIFIFNNAFESEWLGYGTYKLPFIIEFGDCLQTLTIGLGGNPFSSTQTYEAGQVIKVMGDWQIQSGINVILNAPEVRIEGLVIPKVGSTVTIQKDGCND